MPYPWTDQDRAQMAAKGIPQEQSDAQLSRFEQGVPPTRLDRPCTVGDGIVQLTDTDRAAARVAYGKARAEGRLGKFVPASGAASRMFKPLLELLASDEAITPDSLRKADQRGEKNAGYVLRFLDGLVEFAFAGEVQSVCGMEDPGRVLDDPARDLRPLLACITGNSGLNLAGLPKGLIPFHRHEGDVRTPVDEHLLEARDLVADDAATARVHFTVPPAARDAFERARAEGTARFPGTRFEIEFSVQEEFTDTLAADLDNQPFRQKDGRLLFRPGGHGALLHNLNQLEMDFCFIKNVDNVVPPNRADLGLSVRRDLGGQAVLLSELRDRLYHTVREHAELSDAQAEEILAEIRTVFGLGADSTQLNPSRESLLAWLNRPLRVAGMVRNEGEPGGGPFWVHRRDGRVDCQIVETSQVDLDDPGQKTIVSNATHFNPVDLVCALRGPDGERFDLHRFSDPDAAFIATKSKDGRDLKALELPGLWNGAMADWITVFVEIPVDVFTPVKSVNDLLKPEHQADR